MSDINFCNTKEQLNHLGEVVTGKTNGSPTGADIETSTLPYTGQIRKTLPALEGEYEQSITDKESEADEAIDNYRLLSKGAYAPGITLEDKFQYITYSGESYFATNPPYTTTATTPDVDGNLFVGGYLTSVSNQDFGFALSGVQVKHRRGTNAEILAGVPAIAELWFNTTNDTIHMGNGATPGGVPFPKKKTTMLRFDSVAQAVSNTELKVGYSVAVDDYYGGANPNGSGVLFFTVVAGGTSVADGGKFIDVAIGLQLKQNLKLPYSVKAWGAVLDQDMTIPTQNALDYVSSIGGGSVYGTEGINYLSIANSRHRHPDDNTARVCLLLPENTRLHGLGKGVTTYQRVVAERDVDGVLMCNENYDRNGGYTADGNIEIHDFSITDGAAAPTRAIGDLIGIGHCLEFRAYNIKGLNHDLHLFDICASDEVYIDETCEGSNEVLDISSSTIQIDGATSLGIWGLFQDNTDTKNIKVRGKYKNIGALRTIDLFHADDIDYESIDINCEVDGAYVNNGQCIGIDDSKTAINVTGLKVRGKYKTNNSNSTAVRLSLNPETGKKVDQVDIDVEVSGNGKGGVLVGVGTTGVANRWGTVRSKVRARVVTDYTGTSSEVYGAQYNGIDNLFMSPEDDISVVKSSTIGVAVMAAALIQDCKGDSDGGRYQVNLTAGGSNKYVSPVIVRHFFSVIRDFDFRMSKPILEAGSGVGHHFVGDDNATWGLNNNDNFLLTKAKFINQAQISNILEPIKLSDGTNGYRQVQLDGSTDGEFAISSGQFYSGRNMGMKKTGDAAGLVNVKLIYAPNPGTLDTDAEELNFAYVSPTSCAGTQIADINPTLGTFSIVTGDAGVSAVINNATFQPFLRPDGVIKAWVGI